MLKLSLYIWVRHVRVYPAVIIFIPGRIIDIVTLYTIYRRPQHFWKGGGGPG